MRNRRIIGWLLLGIFAVVAVHLLSDLSGSGGDVSLRRETLLPGADAAVAITVCRTGAQTFRMAREDGWRFFEPFVAKADGQRVDRMTDALAFAPVQDSLSDSELLRLGRTREDFALAPARLSVKVTDAKGRETTVLFGAMTPAGDGAYAAVEGIGAVFVVGTNVISAVDLPLDSFRRRRLLSVGADEVVGLDIRSGSGRHSSFFRQGESWRMTEPRQAKATKAAVTGFLDGLVAAEVERFVWPVGVTNEAKSASVSLLAGYGLDPETCTSVTLKLPNGTESSLSFGRESGDGFVYALVPSGMAVVTVPAALKDAALADSSIFTDTHLFSGEAAQMDVMSLGDGETVCQLARDANGAWRLDAPVTGPADATVAATILDRLLALRSSDLDRNGLRVAVATNAEPVAVSRFSVLGNYRLEDLRSRDILRIEPSGVKRIVVSSRNGGRPIAVVYNSDRRAWNADARVGVSGAVVESAVASLLKAISVLKASEVVRLKVSASELANYGLDDPTWTIAIDRIQADAVRRNILIGSATANGRYVTIGSSDAVFLVDNETVAKLTAALVENVDESEGEDVP